MRACSFLPAATSIIVELGLAENLVGVTFECALGRPRVVRSVFEGEKLSSAEIDRRVREAAASAQDLYWIDEPQLAKLSPEIIFTQDVCAVCQIDTIRVERALERLPKRPRLVPLNPQRLADVFTDIQTIASALGENGRGEILVETLHRRIESVRRRVDGLQRLRVSFLEWLDPIFNSGHWIPEQIEIAGGQDLLGAPGGYSSAIKWEDIRKYDPEVIIASACGFEEKRTLAELTKLETLPGWNDIQAVKSGNVFAADSRLFTEPGPRLVDGIELLAELFHDGESARFPLCGTVPHTLPQSK